MSIIAHHIASSLVLALTFCRCLSRCLLPLVFAPCIASKMGAGALTKPKFDGKDAYQVWTADNVADAFARYRELGFGGVPPSDIPKVSVPFSFGNLEGASFRRDDVVARRRRTRAGDAQSHRRSRVRPTLPPATPPLVSSVHSADVPQPLNCWLASSSLFAGFGLLVSPFASHHIPASSRTSGSSCSTTTP